MGAAVVILVLAGVGVTCWRVLAGRRRAGAERQLVRLAFEPESKLRLVLAESSTWRIRQLWRWSDEALREDHVPQVSAAYANLRDRLLGELESRHQRRTRRRSARLGRLRLPHSKI